MIYDDVMRLIFCSITLSSLIAYHVFYKKVIHRSMKMAATVEYCLLTGVVLTVFLYSTYTIYNNLTFSALSVCACMGIILIYDLFCRVYGSISHKKTRFFNKLSGEVNFERSRTDGDN